MNKNLNKARINKNDDFYTRIEDIEREMYYYRKHFKNKIILANCNDPEKSKFYFYFKQQFKFLGLKKLITTCYVPSTLFDQGKKAYKIEVEIIKEKIIETKTYLKSDGDFRNSECIAILKKADLVITNPPFSLFRDYVNQLITHSNKFLIFGNMNAISYVNIFNFFKQEKIWTGYTNPKLFITSQKK